MIKYVVTMIIMPEAIKVMQLKGLSIAHNEMYTDPSAVKSIMESPCVARAFSSGIIWMVGDFSPLEEEAFPI